MNVIIFGATGMVGRGALLECLDDERVDRVLLVSRHPGNVSDPKVREILHDDFFDVSGLRSEFAPFDACFFCLGVSSVGMSEREYRRVTYDLTLAVAMTIASATSQRLTFCYVSGEGTDSAGRGRASWARIKGETENALLRLPFKAAFMFRPGYIQPLRGIRSKTMWYRAFYAALGAFYRPMRWLAPRYVTSTVNVGRAMIQVAASGYSNPILRSDDINRLAACRSTVPGTGARGPRAAPPDA